MDTLYCRECWRTAHRAPPLRRYVPDRSADFVSLDPPFDSAQNYNAFSHEKDGTDAASQRRREGG